MQVEQVLANELGQACTRHDWRWKCIRVGAFPPNGGDSGYEGRDASAALSSVRKGRKGVGKPPGPPKERVSTTQEQRMIVNNHTVDRKGCVVILFRGLDGCEEDLSLTFNIRCPKPNQT